MSEDFGESTDGETLSAEETHFDELTVVDSELVEVSDEVDEFQPQAYRPPGPGLPESLGWIFLFFVCQIVGMIIVFAGVLAMTISDVQELQGFNFQAWLASLSPTLQLVVMASPALVGYFGLIPLGLLRLTPRPISRLNLNLPTAGQVVVAASLVLPLTMVANSIMSGIDPFWQQLVERIPALSGLNMDVHDMLAQFGNASLPAALFLIAVVPGIGEEFLFRGLIGRGLVARWGLIAGVGITSFLFAAVHIFPPHVIAILPVGIALHWIYLTTKSFWAPVLFHFLNNGIATILMRAEQSEEELHWSIIPLSVGYFVWCLYWLYQMRTIHQTEEGPISSPGYEVAVPENVECWRESKTYIAPVLIGVAMIALEIYIIAIAFSPA